MIIMPVLTNLSFKSIYLSGDIYSVFCLQSMPLSFHETLHVIKKCLLFLSKKSIWVSVAMTTGKQASKFFRHPSKTVRTQLTTFFEKSSNFHFNAVLERSVKKAGGAEKLPSSFSETKIIEMLWALVQAVVNKVSYFAESKADRVCKLAWGSITKVMTFM